MLLESATRSISLEEITSIYYRRPQPRKVKTGPPETDRFISLETSMFARWLWVALQSKFWVSHPLAIRRADSKIEQLRIAPQLGFKIPRTIISNKPSDVRAFFDRCNEQVICKVLATGVVKDDAQSSTHHIYANRLKRSDLIDEATAVVPCQYQEYMPKAYELRITVVGEAIFATEIHSQASPRTRDDWRRYDLPNTPHKQHVLPDQVRESCLALVKFYGLQFGAIDMIVTPSGEYVFLEINPNGQWGWIEELTGFPIAESIADLLISHA